MPSRLGHGLYYKKIDRLKNIFRCIYITRNLQVIGEGDGVRVSSFELSLSVSLHAEENMV